MTVSMQRPSDCGPVAMANHIEAAIGGYADAAYRRAMTEFGFPDSDGIVADLWDSPTRHFKVLERITGQKVGLVEGLAHPGPCVVLLRLSLTAWHWVSVIRPGLWHDGKKLVGVSFDERYPGAKVVLAYALGYDNPLPWYWSVWWTFTRFFVGGMP